MEKSKYLQGVSYMLINSMALAFYYVLSKHLVLHMHPNQVAFLKKFFILLAILPWCCFGGIKKSIKTDKIVTHFIRAAFGTLGTLCYLYAVKTDIMLINITAITYLEQILVCVVGVVYFKEKFTKGKLICIILSIIGVNLIINISQDNFSIGYVYIFLAIIFWVGNNTAIKILGRTEKSKSQIFYMMLFSSLFTLPLAISEWRPLVLEDVKYIVLLSTCALIHTASFFKSFKKSEMSLVIPFDYTRIIFTGILGYYFFDELIDQLSLLGYLFIISGGVVLLYSENLKYRKKYPASSTKSIR